MGLDELHARRLATVVAMFESALDRIELVLERAGAPPAESRISRHQIRQTRQMMQNIRGRLKSAVERFSIVPTKPEPRQVLSAELSSLWVMLENAMPRRMKGYGREFAPGDKADWEKLIQGLLKDVEQIRSIVLSDPEPPPGDD